MSQYEIQSRPPTRRGPLADATTRVNNSQVLTPPLLRRTKSSLSHEFPHHESLKANDNLQVPNSDQLLITVAEDKRLSALAEEDQASNRSSQISATSAKSYSEYKKRIGPWKLGKNLGEGSTGRVRQGKHALTGQMAAIKIVSKKSALAWQSKSVAAMDRLLAVNPSSLAGNRTMPFGIEREIVIMKLIEHPNIVSLYDVWENRGELYVVMENVEGGELYEYIRNNGYLPEQEAVRLFRQIISGIAYCHRFTLCHRDLKPENILLDSEGNAKIVDFGMAAIQPNGKKLETSCGSPHYAPPEIASGQKYHGAQVDIWSCGVILYAMLCGSLPFGTGHDNEQLREVLKDVIRAEVNFPEGVSIESQDLILRMLQRSPENRISIASIWKHPLIRKYDRYPQHPQHAAQWIGGPLPELTMDDFGEPLRNRSDIDGELLRNLCILWQTTDEKALIGDLLSDIPNHKKLLYNSLRRFRDEQLENYQGNIIEFSNSDYHHAAKPTVRKSATRASVYEPGLHSRRRSQYSLFSDNARRPSNTSHRTPSAAGTVQSYDPYRPSLHQIAHPPVNYANVTICRDETDATQRRRFPSGVGSVRHPALARIKDEGIYSIPTSPQPQSQPTHSPFSDHRKNSSSRNYSRTSIASSQLSRASTGGARKSMSYKRGVSFKHMRRSVASSGAPSSQLGNISSPPTLQQRYLNDRLDSSTLSLPAPESPHAHAGQAIRSKKEGPSQSIRIATRHKRNSQYWKEEARQVSIQLEKYCDEAFNTPDARKSIGAPAPAATQHLDPHSQHPSDPSSNQKEISHSDRTRSDNRSANREIKKDAHYQRPLPEPPVNRTIDDYAQQELAKTIKSLERRAADLNPGALDDVIAHLNRLMQPSQQRSAEQEHERRITSAPGGSSSDFAYLSPVKEENEDGRRQRDVLSPTGARQGPRTASDPISDRNKTYDRQRSNKDIGYERATIRFVDQTVDPRPAPLVIRKRSGLGATPGEGFERQKSHRQITPDLKLGRVNVTADDVIPARPQSRLGFNEDRNSVGLGLLKKHLDPIVETDNIESTDLKGTKRQSDEGKKWGWFRRDRGSHGSNPSQDSDSAPPPPLKDDWFANDNVSKTQEKSKRFSDVPSADSQHTDSKKKSSGTNKFLKIFSKGDSKQSKGASEMALRGRDLEDEQSDAASHAPSAGYMSGALQNNSTASVGASIHRTRTKSTDPPVHRTIQPLAQSWLSRFLHIKPATKVLAFQITSIRARREVVGIFRSWKRHGMTDIFVDRVVGRIWASVGEQNLLKIRPVSLACEVFPIFVRGRKANLCVIRFSQEKGAKSSFEKVIGTLESILKKKSFIVTDKRKSKEMRSCLAQKKD